MKLSLDIGVGGKSWTVTTKQNKSVSVDIEKPKKKLENFVLADCHFLPFKNDCFYYFLMKDVLEHLNSPIKCLNEIKRVSCINGKINILTPNSLFFTKIILSIKRSLVKNSIPYNPHLDHSLIWGIPELIILLKKAKYKKVNVSLIENKYSEKRNVFELLKFIMPYHIKYYHILAECVIK